MLRAHPDIYMIQPVRPEPKYFLRDRNSITREDYIGRYFSGVPQRFRGEKSTSYLDYPEKLATATEFFCTFKVNIILRNPVDRAISNYRFSVENGLETRSVEDVFINGKSNPVIDSEISVDPFDYLGRGIYYSYLQSLYKYFHPENVMVTIFENVVSSTEILQKVYAFLGVDNSFRPNKFSDVVNSSDNSKIVSNEVMTYLNQFYKPHNKKLTEFVDVSLW
jgi:hypothetical protein